MAKDNEIRNFTAADIERYHRGLLTPKERHAMEKAALDDPFLAEALEGYALPGVNREADLAELQQRLAARITEGNKKVVALPTRSTTPARWWRVAAMVVVLAGIGLLIYTIGFNNKENEVAVVSAEKKVQEMGNAQLNAPTSDTGTGQAAKDTLGSVSEQKNQSFPNGITKTVPPTSSAINTDSVSTTYNYSTDKILTVPSSPELKAKEEKDNINRELSGKLAAKSQGIETKSANAAPSIQNADTLGTMNEALTKYKDNDDKKAVAANARRADNNYRGENNYFASSNTFRGRVTDNNNNPVPFANVTNTDDNVGTYADARGFFNLTSPDSTLNVQVKGLGYNNFNVLLRPNIPTNQVVLQEDKSVNAIVISNKKPNASTRTKDANMKLEEPEPEDGWDNYDTYLANNLNVPDEYKTKKPGPEEVKLSFEVNKYGEPVNFKVEKSLCSRCDEEAIRLVKEGPKWKRKARKGRTTVTISF